MLSARQSISQISQKRRIWNIREAEDAKSNALALCVYEFLELAPQPPWIADHNEWPNRIQQFVAFSFFRTRRYDIAGQKLLRSNKLIVCFSPWLHLNILETEKMLRFGKQNGSRRAWHVPALPQRMNYFVILPDRFTFLSEHFSFFALQKKKKISEI